MKGKLTSFLFAVLVLALASTAMATTTWQVNGVTGSDSNNCLSTTTACKTIGHAISLAASGDTIRVASATYTENLSIGKNLKILGSGAKTTIVDGGAVFIAQGGVVFISSGAHVTLSGMTFRHGVALAGGGIWNFGTLALNRSAITGNLAKGSAGGLFNVGTATINASTISGNVVLDLCGPVECDKVGAGIENDDGSNLVVNNSTISANADGAILSLGGLVIISNSTIAGNASTSTGNGGGIAMSSGTVILQNAVLANTGNCFGTITSKGHNLSSDKTCNFSVPGDMNNTDPMLGPLQYNGGPTQTMALPSGSPAVDAGNPAGCTDGSGHLLKTDQRGAPRPDAEDVAEGKLGCDIGAYERQSD
ncbi:MAG TPA: choice-of-anchor Q domain-containing protein [Terriglobales bacterium]|nr:choice-of-anchor Q domain-containing protein [Terriglobales bacterium]